MINEKLRLREDGDPTLDKMRYIVILNDIIRYIVNNEDKATQMFVIDFRAKK